MRTLETILPKVRRFLCLGTFGPDVLHAEG